VSVLPQGLTQTIEQARLSHRGRGQPGPPRPGTPQRQGPQYVGLTCSNTLITTRVRAPRAPWATPTTTPSPRRPTPTPPGHSARNDLTPKRNPGRFKRCHAASTNTPFLLEIRQTSISLLKSYTTDIRSFGKRIISTLIFIENN